VPRPSIRHRLPAPGRMCRVAGLVLLVGVVAVARADDGGERPAWSRLGRPVERAPVLLTGALNTGGLFAHEQLQPGYTVGVLMRPARAAELLGGLYARNVGLVLRVDVHGAGTQRRTISGDLVFRRYLSDMRPVRAGRSLFWGLGVGVTEARAPLPTGKGHTSNGFSFLGEVGLETAPKAGLVLLLAAQYRHYQHDGFDYAGWSCRAGLGIPFPL